MLPPLLAGLLWMFDRWQVRRGTHFESGLRMHFGWLLALSFIGCLTHPLLDWQTSYAVQLFSPLDRRWFHADTLFIIDVWIWSTLGLAVWLARRWRRAGRGDWMNPPRAAIGAVLAYVGGNSVLTWLAYKAPSSEQPYAVPDRIVASPPPVLFWRRDLVWRQGHNVWRGRYDPFNSLFGLQAYTGPEHDRMNDPLVRAVLNRTPELESFRNWSIMPVARIERGRCRVVVHLSDARFAALGRSGPMSRSVSVPTDADGC